MAAKTAVVNYTPEQTAEVIEAYRAGVTVEQIAVAAGKSVRSIVAKLSREGVYTKKADTKSGQPVVSKDAHAEAIGAILGLEQLDSESLAKANKAALVAVFEALSK
jgi:hypothetical protein